MAFRKWKYTRVQFSARPVGGGNFLQCCSTVTRISRRRRKQRSLAVVSRIQRNRSRKIMEEPRKRRKSSPKSRRRRTETGRERQGERKRSRSWWEREKQTLKTEFEFRLSHSAGLTLEHIHTTHSHSSLHTDYQSTSARNTLQHRVCDYKALIRPTCWINWPADSPGIFKHFIYHINI